MNECLYCKRERYYHGGKCSRKDSSQPCLIFERDPRGERVFIENVRLDLDFGTDIPEIGKPDDDWKVCGINKTITVKKILKVEWNTDAKGLQGIYIWVDYWYWSDENGVIVDKPRLVLCR